MQAVGDGLREGVAEALEPLGVQRGPRQKASGTRGGLPSAIDGAALQDMLDGANRLHATGGEAPPSEGQAAEAAFDLAEAPDWTSMRGWDDLREAFATGSLEGWHGLRMFWGAWDAALCAWSSSVSAPR
jgi:hypothetical protein